MFLYTYEVFLLREVLTDTITVTITFCVTITYLREVAVTKSAIHRVTLTVTFMPITLQDILRLQSFKKYVCQNEKCCIEFYSIRNNSKFCSPKCKMAYHRSRILNDDLSEKAHPIGFHTFREPITPKAEPIKVKMESDDDNTQLLLTAAEEKLKKLSKN